MKQRIEYIDLAKGFCISFVVLFHVFGNLSGDFIKIMNLFRMPLYFILSGLFFKTYDGFGGFMKKKTNKLVVPFLFCYFVTIIPSTILLSSISSAKMSINEIIYNNYGRINLGINGASWFLLCLFFINFFFYIVFLISNHNIKWITFFSCLCGFAGYFLNSCDLYLPMWMDTALTAMPFFLFGYYLRKYTNILQSHFNYKDIVSGILSLLLLVCIYCINSFRGHETICYGDNLYDIGILSLYTGGFVGTYFILIFAKYFGRIPMISYIGRYSIVVLLTHLLYIFIIRNILFQMEISQDSILVNTSVFIITILISIPTIWFCKKYLPFFFAQKDLF
jgi:fucose 4-O-acetylase-like acetyltransferase